MRSMSAASTLSALKHSEAAGGQRIDRTAVAAASTGLVIGRIKGAVDGAVEGRVEPADPGTAGGGIRQDEGHLGIAGIEQQQQAAGVMAALSVPDSEAAQALILPVLLR